MSKKDIRMVVIVGAAVGLLIQPILANTISMGSLSVLARIGIFVFFALLAPFALWLASLLSRAWKGIYQFAQFAAVGTLNSFIDVGVFNLETFILGTATVSTVMFATFKAISFLCATTNSFFWNKYWTFSASATSAADDAEKKTKETVSFYAVALAGWVVNVGVATCVKIAEPAGMSPRLWVNIVAPVCGIAASFLWDFFGYKYFVFKKKS
jgi:putative flippase GtrA